MTPLRFAQPAIPQEPPRPRHLKPGHRAQERLAQIPGRLRSAKPGHEIQTPMAIVILFGLLTSMLLNMMIVPALSPRFGPAVTSPSQPAKVSA